VCFHHVCIFYTSYISSIDTGGMNKKHRESVGKPASEDTPHHTRDTPNVVGASEEAVEELLQHAEFTRVHVEADEDPLAALGAVLDHQGEECV
jgi:hypothetical protein